ncbi:hypothetical protein P167DRAFT_578344 [Morchella conica CCBAS932]|uniref:Uncharacterized protein n=1 Tax=Morchella conica CCBAS932 TaxID=1392247 RepID=A0A3N4KRI1_9PEZI|nr:hypothetical protein P167DRAFT_578344 [Morchella conica CCBAS932]
MAKPLNNPTDDFNTNPRPHPTTSISDDHAIPKQFCPLDITKASLHALQEGAWGLATTAFELIAAHAFQDDPISSSSSSSSSQASKAPDDVNLEPTESRAIIVARLDQAVFTPLPVPRIRMKCSTCKRTKWNYSLIIGEGGPLGGEEFCTSDHNSECEDEMEQEEEKDWVTNETIDMIHFCPTLPVQVWNGERFVERPCTHGLEVIER